jgi:hypothetical protein
MTEYKKDYVDTERQYSGPSGNASRLMFKMTTTAGGIVEDSDAAAALGSGDTVVLGVLPAGMTLTGAKGIVSDAFVGSSTAAIGFRYVDGVDVTATPEDADYFWAALVLNAQGRTLENNLAVAPVTLPKDAYLVLTHSAHTQNEAGRLDVVVEGILGGPR